MLTTQQDSLFLGILVYYCVASGCALLVMAHDKLAARAERWRVPERNLHLLSIAGGWPGTWLACMILRHKIRKHTFRSALKAAAMMNIALLAAAVTAYLHFGVLA